MAENFQFEPICARAALVGTKRVPVFNVVGHHLEISATSPDDREEYVYCIYFRSTLS